MIFPQGNGLWEYLSVRGEYRLEEKRQRGVKCLWRVLVWLLTEVPCGVLGREARRVEEGSACMPG